MLLAESMLRLREDIFDAFEIEVFQYLSLPQLSKDLFLKVNVYVQIFARETKFQSSFVT